MTAQWKSNEPVIPTGACTGSYGRQVSVNLTVNGTQDFDYRGSVDCAYLRKTGYYKLEVWGAKGGDGSGYVGGYGGYAFGRIYAQSNSSIYIVVGQAGVFGLNEAVYSYNGGGYNRHSNRHAAKGGGATHISVQNCGELKNCSSYKGTYDSSKGTYDGGKILIVAGGGGGGHHNNTAGQNGNGGGYYGSGCRGGNQTSGGTCSDSNASLTYGQFGLGGANCQAGTESNCGSQSGGYPNGGGGGGWYGGGTADTQGPYVSSGGGSGYIGNSLLLQDKGMYMYNSLGGCNSSTSVATKTTCTSSYGTHIANAANTGNGYARITYLGT